MRQHQQRPFVNLTYYDTYHLANIVNNVLEDQFSYIRGLDDFYGDDRHLRCVVPFQRVSAFHAFIQFIVASVIDEEAGNVDLEERQRERVLFAEMRVPADPPPRVFPVNLALNRLGIEHETFVSWMRERSLKFGAITSDHVEEYYETLREDGAIEELVVAHAREIFYVLFQNRHALLLFNDMMARQVQRSAEEDVGTEYAIHFARPGVLRRVAIPAWVERAVFFRDRGLCVLCHKDVSGTLSIGSRCNYDHIVPLASGGLNDVTNLQLLCHACNATKHAGAAFTSNSYESWYSDGL